MKKYDAFKILFITTILALSVIFNQANAQDNNIFVSAETNLEKGISPKIGYDRILFEENDAYLFSGLSLSRKAYFTESQSGIQVSQKEYSNYESNIYLGVGYKYNNLNFGVYGGVGKNENNIKSYSKTREKMITNGKEWTKETTISTTKSKEIEDTKIIGIKIKYGLGEGVSLYSDLQNTKVDTKSYGKATVGVNFSF